MRKQVSARSCPVQLASLNRQRKIVGAHLPMRELFAQRQSRRQLIGGEREHNQMRPRPFPQQPSQAKVPIQVLRLLDTETTHFVLRGETIVQVVELPAFQ